MAGGGRGRALVAQLLNKLKIEQTKSRPRRSNDNGLVEAKNGAVIRKHMGYLHIQSEHAQDIHSFYRDHLNPYLNFHRPCGQPELSTDGTGASSGSSTNSTSRRGICSASYRSQPPTCGPAKRSPR